MSDFEAPESDIASAMGLALAVIAAMIERSEHVPEGEVGRCLSLLAETAAPDQPRQRAILADWARLLTEHHFANDA